MGRVVVTNTHDEKTPQLHKSYSLQTVGLGQVFSFVLCSVDYTNEILGDEDLMIFFEDEFNHGCMNRFFDFLFLK